MVTNALKLLSVLTLVGCVLAFLVGCMMALTHGSEDEGGTVINYALGIGALNLFLGWIGWLAQNSEPS